MNLSTDNFTLTQALPTINRQIELLQVDNRRPHALVSFSLACVFREFGHESRNRAGLYESQQCLTGTGRRLSSLRAR